MKSKVLSTDTSKTRSLLLQADGAFSDIIKRMNIKNID
jgi:hypothetical protein